MATRDQQLNLFSEIVINGRITRKLDFLGTVSIYNWQYFNVWRRYNNPYEIVLEDQNGDFYFHHDCTVRQSLQRILCLTNEQMKNIMTLEVIPFKTQSIVHQNVVNVRWTEIQQRWCGASINLGGILEDFHATAQAYQEEKAQQEEQQQQEQSWEPFSLPQPPRGDRPPFPTNEIEPTNLSDRFTQMEEQKNVRVLRNGKVIKK
jgi:hypothetical protein